MGIFNIYNKAKNHINKSYFSEKHVISFQAYNLLKKYIVKGLAESKSLDKAYPKNLRMNVLKNVSHRSMKTFYKLSDYYKKNKNGVLFQTNSYPVNKRISSKAKILLKKIKEDQPRYTEIDELIKKTKSS
jgi:hypothetical protein